jgi:hypothetical protein
MAVALIPPPPICDGGGRGWGKVRVASTTGLVYIYLIVF